MRPRHERIEIQKKLEKSLPKVRKQLEAIPGVISVGFGLREKNQECIEEYVYRVYVKQKIADPSKVPADELIPAEIAGFPTDVIETPVAVDRQDTSKHRPITGGVQIGRSMATGVGTLGCFATLNSDGSPVLLTNEHVLFADSSAGAGDDMGQPELRECCCCTCNEIATILGSGINNATVDCAIAKINSGISIDAVQTNAMAATFLRVNGTAAAVIGDAVQKVGRTSGMTSGTVVDPSGPALNSAGVTIRSGQILIHPTATETFTERTNGKRAFSDAGDSGSAIVGPGGNIIGLLWGGDPANFPVDRTFACHIAAVLTALSGAGQAITITTTPVGRSLITPRFETPSEARELEPMFAELEREVKATRVGRVAIRRVLTHREEVFSLVNENRRVGVAWQRHEGPAFLAALARSVKRPDYEIPERINGISAIDLLEKMGEVLEVHGSERLARDITAIREPVRSRLTRVSSVREVMRLFEAVDLEELPIDWEEELSEARDEHEPSGVA